MTKDLLPEAFYDSLAIAHKLDDYLDGFKEAEIHLFAYFSLLLFLYKSKGKNLIDWGYNFIVRIDGYPFSNDLYNSINKNLQNGFFEKKSNYLIITSRGVDEFKTFKKQKIFQMREKYLEATCTTTIAVPFRQTLKALKSEPQLKHIRDLAVHDPNKWIVNDGDHIIIYEKLKELSKAIGVKIDDLFISAVTWINYLNEVNNQTNRNEEEND